ncbi:FG-GAP repeat protein [Planctomycetes bacterium Poly30]|uniref:FG-GAP repeat protein n=1 Tax=Saltatorellus ferox TaxID=2528018 RepID=A0A518EKM3_9BACT|nr:FG-GAP repeat protein [Planctomycetes bacterium Poly30]
MGLLFALTLIFVAIQGRRSAPRPAPDSAGLRFEEVARAVGVAFTHTKPRIDELVAHVEPQVAATGAAVSMTDVNADGWPDLYAVTSGEGENNGLFVNRGDGTFEDRAAEAGLADLNRDGTGASMGSIWADVDGNGLEDVLVYKWGRSQLFLNRGDLRFENVTETSGLDAWVNSNCATWIDYDRDGLLDLFLAGYYDENLDLTRLETTKIFHDSLEFAQNGGENHLYRNLGNGRFEDVTEAAGMTSRRWTYAAVAADFDRDGWPDLYVANDYGSEELWLNRGGERFELARWIGLDGESKSGMCVALGDTKNEGRYSVFVTNISKRGFLFQGNNLRLNLMDEARGFQQRGRGAVLDCGWAWGAQFGDLDDDGRQDLVVVNGFVSASTERDYWYQMSKLGGAAGGLVVDAQNWPAFEDRSLSGYERTRVLLNQGGSAPKFVESGLEVGVDDTYDGRAVALGDLDRDGDLDIVIANQAGPLLIYRNQNASPGHWIAFDLVGLAPNTSAIGAEVEVAFGDGKQLQVVAAAMGFSSQNERRLHFGLGDVQGPVSATIRWPSGKISELSGLEVDTAHHVQQTP